MEEGQQWREEGWKEKTKLESRTSMEGEVLTLQVRGAHEGGAGWIGTRTRVVGVVEEGCSRSWWQTRSGRFRYVVGIRCS